MPYQPSPEFIAESEALQQLREELGWAQFERDWKRHAWGIGKIAPIEGQTVADLQAKEQATNQGSK